MSEPLPLDQIWNPWHGCHKYSEGCDNRYMFYLDRQRNKRVDQCHHREQKKEQKNEFFCSLMNLQKL